MAENLNDLIGLAQAALQEKDDTIAAVRAKLTEALALLDKLQPKELED